MSYRVRRRYICDVCGNKAFISPAERAGWLKSGFGFIGHRFVDRRHYCSNACARKGLANMIKNLKANETP